MAFNYETDRDTIFEWIVQVDPKQDALQYRVEDTLPVGVELAGLKVRDGLTVWNYKIDQETHYNVSVDGGIINATIPGWGSQTNVTGSVVTDGDGRGVVDITLTPANGVSSTILSNTFYIVYYCKFKESAWPENGTISLTLNNSVKVQADSSNYGRADNTIVANLTKMKKVIDKSGIWDKNSHTITYTIDINPDAENLLVSEDGQLDPETLTLTDILTYTWTCQSGTGEVVLNLNSVLLEREIGGQWETVPNVSWEAHTEIDPDDPTIKHAHIVMEIPDSAHLRLSYIYCVNCSMTGGISLTNTITLEGEAQHSDEEPINIDEEDFETSGESSCKEFKLVKLDAGTGLPVAGAEFTVYRWELNAQTGTYEWVSTGKTYVTDSNGSFIIRCTDTYEGTSTRVYAHNTAFCIMETAAPVGYIMPDNPMKYYFWYSNNQTSPDHMPEDFMLTAADVATASRRAEAENERESPYLLPETGGPGELICIFGGILLTGISLILIKKFRYYYRRCRRRYSRRYRGMRLGSRPVKPGRGVAAKMDY
ncbi:MAG: SpaA isopeptide-forming pilin-related protein [Lachnospiraceae bacterium]|jgi:hypothetical protein